MIWMAAGVPSVQRVVFTPNTQRFFNICSVCVGVEDLTYVTYAFMPYVIKSNAKIFGPTAHALSGLFVSLAFI